MTPSPFTPAGLAISKIVAGISPPRDRRFAEPMPAGFDDEEFPVEFDNDEPRVPHTPREEEFA